LSDRCYVCHIIFTMTYVEMLTCHQLCAVPGVLTAMDCADITIGAARGNLSRVGDFYTRDRTTPRHDEFYGGTQSLTAAVGSESSDGVTTIMFRKKLIGMCAISYCSTLFRLIVVLITGILLLINDNIFISSLNVHY